MTVPPMGTVTFLFTDIEGSTRLWEHDAPAMQEALARHDKILRSVVTEHGGHVFKMVGDACCVAFSSAPEALEAAISAQRAIFAEPWNERSRVRVRMALHTGEGEERSGDYFGPPLNRVARLLSAGHGGQTLVSRATRELVRDELPEGAELRDLGEVRLKDLIKPEQVFQLVVADLPSSFPPLKTLDERLNNLPAQPTPLVGREREVAEICRLLRRKDVQLLTLTGLGGTGKTRLGLQAAADLVDEFEDGVFFVALAPITDPNHVAATIARLLGVMETGKRTPAEGLKDYLRAKELLLVLDNFERVVDAAPLVVELLAACPRLKVLAISRGALQVYGEKEYAVLPLTLPDPERQRTLRDAIEWSHDLLDAGEKTLFRRLAVFSGGRTLEAVEAVCDAEGDLPVDVLDGVSSLVDKSLLRREEGPEDEPRFVMLETIHEFAREKLQESGEAEETRRLHAEYFLALAEEAEPELGGPQQVAWLNRLEAEHDNLRAALSWSLEAGEAELGLRLAGTLWWFWFARGHLSEGRGWLDDALARSDAAASVRAAGLIGAGRLAVAQADRREAEVLLEESVRLLRDSADERGLAKALHNLGFALLAQGNSERAGTLQKESLSLFRKARDGWGVAETLSNLGIVAEHEDDAERAKILYEESLLVRRELRDKRGIGTVLNNLGGLTLVHGDLQQSASLLEESVLLSRELGDKVLLAHSLSTLSIVELLRENPEHAQTLLEESLTLAEKLGDKVLTVQNLLELAGAAGARGQVLRAARLFGATDESCQALAAYFVPSERERHDSLRAAARARLSEGAWKEAWAQGRAMTMDDAVSYALQDDRD
jgi:predicted ATPase/class 3 adenylate cyclase